MNTSERLQRLATAIDRMLATKPTETAAPGLLAGALFALHQVASINAVVQRSPEVDPRYAAELKDVLSNISDPSFLAKLPGFRGGVISTGPWLAGYYLTDATFRVRAAWERLKGAKSKCPLGSEVNHFKHGGKSPVRPVKRHVVDVDGVLDVIDQLNI